MDKCEEAQEFSRITKIDFKDFPSSPQHFSETWKILGSLRDVVEELQVVEKESKFISSLALIQAIGELINISQNVKIIPNRLHRRSIVKITKIWIRALEPIAQKIGNISITQPIHNPYVIGDPVEGSLFVGREDIIRDLEQLWVMSQHLQSVVLYGHRRMGKTSILRNITNRSGAEIKVVYINLQSLGSVSEGMGEVLMAISDGISDGLGVPPPEDEALLRLPQRTFERYLKKVVREMNYKGLIIALDEFEMIEELIEARQIPPNFMGVLVAWVQMYSKVAFVLAGLHKLDEMTEDYFQPFFSKVHTIRIGFLKPASTYQILANPNDNFLLNYTGEALHLIHNLTAGQPYLVQLVGFLLVRRYNEQVFEIGRSRDSTFTIEDVEAVINDPEFFSRGRYYFTGVWNQAKEPPGQHKILEVLAVKTEGLTLNILRQKADLEPKKFDEALETLKRHDVVCETENRCKIIVELFRRWVVENHF
ncbi:MAG: ATP-binding protein [Cyanobacteria bacterium J06592_8]